MPAALPSHYQKGTSIKAGTGSVFILQVQAPGTWTNTFQVGPKYLWKKKVGKASSPPPPEPAKQTVKNVLDLPPCPSAQPTPVFSSGQCVFSMTWNTARARSYGGKGLWCMDFWEKNEALSSDGSWTLGWMEMYLCNQWGWSWWGLPAAAGRTRVSCSRVTGLDES